FPRRRLGRRGGARADGGGPALQRSGDLGGSQRRPVAADRNRGALGAAAHGDPAAPDGQRGRAAARIHFFRPFWSTGGRSVASASATFAADTSSIPRLRASSSAARPNARYSAASS